MGLKVLSLNVNGLNQPAKMNSMWKEAQKHNTDVLYIQEIHFAAYSTAPLILQIVSPHLPCFYLCKEERSSARYPSISKNVY